MKLMSLCLELRTQTLRCRPETGTPAPAPVGGDGWLVERGEGGGGLLAGSSERRTGEGCGFIVEGERSVASSVLGGRWEFCECREGSKVVGP